MKRILTCLTIFFLAMPAMAWKKVLECNGGDAVIDFVDRGYHGQLYQLVIRDSNIIKYFAQKNAVESHRIQGSEMIIPLVSIRDSNDLVGSEDAYKSGGRSLYVKPSNGGLLVEAFATAQATGGHFFNKEKLADWYFESCSL